jgi:hypothetical protein
MISMAAPLEGITRAENLLDTASRRIAGGLPEAGDMIDLMKARNDVAANVKTAGTADQMTKTAIDLFA